MRSPSGSGWVCLHQVWRNVSQQWKWMGAVRIKTLQHSSPWVNIWRRNKSSIKTFIIRVIIHNNSSSVKKCSGLNQERNLHRSKLIQRVKYISTTSTFFSVNIFLKMLLTWNYHQMSITTQAIHTYKDNNTHKFRNDELLWCRKALVGDALLQETHRMHCSDLVSSMNSDLQILFSIGLESGYCVLYFLSSSESSREFAWLCLDHLHHLKQLILITTDEGQDWCLITDRFLISAPRFLHVFNAFSHFITHNFISLYVCIARVVIDIWW